MDSVLVFHLAAISEFDLASIVAFHLAAILEVDPGRHLALIFESHLGASLCLEDVTLNDHCIAPTRQLFYDYQVGLDIFRYKISIRASAHC